MMPTTLPLQESQTPANNAQRLEAEIRALERKALPPTGAPERVNARAALASMWFGILAALDRSLDASFSIDDAPPRTAAPPDIGQGDLPPGIDPAEIEDPLVRMLYEDAIRKNRAKAARYQSQTLLRRLDARATRNVELFLALAFTHSRENREALFAVLDESGLSESRKAALKNPFRT